MGAGDGWIVLGPGWRRGIVLRTLDGPAITHVIKLDLTVSNNEAEYEAVILGLRVVKSLSMAVIELWCDSQLVVSRL